MGGGRTVKGGRDKERRGRGSEGRCENKRVVCFFFILGSYSHSFSGAFPSSLFSPSTP